MRILAIETSADETAVSIVEATGDFPQATYELCGNALRSQIETHAEYGGIFPMLAKREHAKALVPLFRLALEEAGFYVEEEQHVAMQTQQKIEEILEREPNLTEDLLCLLRTVALPDFDLIAVTNGPGLAPALWVGVNFAKALSVVTGTPVVPTNHMEGHVLASIYDIEEDEALSAIAFPTIALLISGGHTELVKMTDWGTYEKIGQTRDDAVGEAFDKVARMLDLPYPGGPEIERLSNQARADNLPAFKTDMPRPMLNSGDLDFSFSGLKTSVLYAIKDRTLSDVDKQAIARDFSDAVADVLIAKSAQAIIQTGAQTLVVGGGVSASQFLRDRFTEYFTRELPDVTVYFPHRPLSTDNSIMIALAGHARVAAARTGASVERIVADSGRSLA